MNDINVEKFAGKRRQPLWRRQFVPPLEVKCPNHWGEITKKTLCTAKLSATFFDFDKSIHNDGQEEIQQGEEDLSTAMQSEL